MSPLDLFQTELQKALNRLYDPVYLRKSSLVGLFGLADRPSAAEALRADLTAAIDALKPPAGTPPTCRSQRIFQVLHYRYIQQFTQVDVSRKLAISPRHLRREQDSALQTLAEALVCRHGLSKDSLADLGSEPLAAKAEENTEAEVNSACWHNYPPEECSASGAVVLEAINLASTLARQRGIALHYEIAPDIPSVRVPATVVKQLVLDMLAYAIRSPHGGRVSLAAGSEGGQLAIRVTTEIAPAHEGLPPIAQDDLQVSERLLTLYEGRIEVRNGEGVLEVLARLPGAGEIPVLAVEDNADTLQLWQRYLQDSPYQLIAVRDSQQALATALQVRPRIIVLDVMMPGLDGWDLLAQLKHHPVTSHVPTIICTVHPQRELALALGAADFVLKPTTRATFLAALEGASIPRES
ncbi:MAG: ATP-binding response regulator [Anaerolineae bacterium]